MQSSLDSILAHYRANAKTEREKGTHFEHLIQKFLAVDPRYTNQFSRIETYADWAKQHGYPQNDAGIDLVATRLDEVGYCALQCKFYAPEHKIQKADLNSFMTASGKTDFTLRLIVDSTNGDWGKNAEAALNNQNPPVQRISLADLRASSIDWAKFLATGCAENKPQYQLREDQQRALDNVIEGFKKADRGKMLMACGTGKTFTSLKIAEQFAGKGKRVLFLVPSLSLMSQTITEWALQAQTPMKCFAVCSDAQVGKRKANDDLADLNTHDLAYPATTKAQKLAFVVEKHASDAVMTVAFATYQSIQVISDAQYEEFSDAPDLLTPTTKPLAGFDLIICDEAHRSTGVTLASESESNFVKVHDQAIIKGHKRLYMTATPRIFSDKVQIAAQDNNALLCSMDDESLFGRVFYSMSFSEAVAKNLLTDYKVLVLAVDEAMISRSLQARLADENNELNLDDATKIIGCYRALTKLDIKKDLPADHPPVQRGVAFCRDIKSSKRIVDEFANVVQSYIEHEMADAQNALQCALQHVDGTYNASRRNARLAWLKQPLEDNTCHILSNARCLSEGVDVPTLDAILFMHPRKSQIDVVQSVGRVMRRAPGKALGYVILPVGVPSGLTPNEALNNNDNYRVVWEILNALRAHDDRFNANINKMQYGGDMSKFIEIVAVTETLRDENKPKDHDSAGIGKGNATSDAEFIADTTADYTANSSFQNPLVFDEFQQAVYAKIVKKCGERNYWVDWAGDIAKIAQNHISRINGILAANAHGEKQAFDAFVTELRDDLNNSISNDDAIEMLAQHIITQPVFDALFAGYHFTKANPVSQAMQTVLQRLNAHNLQKESASLDKFYADVQMRTSGIETLDGKQRIVVELYDKFFRNAFPRMTERLGIVYTPVEVVDFIIHSVNDLLQQEFGYSLGSEGVHIIDPFTGTGTFITRLLQSGLISKQQLPHKYKTEIHSNEIVLLAYYIAAINIESAYHAIINETVEVGQHQYQPFEGICLTDTFQMYEKDDLISNLMADNSDRRKRQKALDIRVVIGNPPYSAGQKSANDNNANIAYPQLDSRISETYADRSNATNKNALYDSYIRAIRWASDRVCKNRSNHQVDFSQSTCAAQCQCNGVIGFVTNAGFLEANTAAGLRQCLADEFSRIYIFHLRGNARTQGELRRKEKDNIFGPGSRTPVAISLLVKNPQAAQHGQIYFHDIGDYLSRKQKLEKIAGFVSTQGISQANQWQTITPDAHGDWLNQRDDSFNNHIVLGDKDKKGSQRKLFDNYSNGLKTQRDAWCYNASRQSVALNMNNMISFYNSEVERFNSTHAGLNTKNRTSLVDSFINNDSTQISWTSALKQDLAKNHAFEFDSSCITQSLYRPYNKQYLYMNRRFNERVYQMPRIFPEGDKTENLVIAISGNGAKEFSLLISKTLPDHSMETGAQCFPLYLYEKANAIDSGGTRDLFTQAEAETKSANGYTRKDGISDEGLKHVQQAYPNEQINKEDIFYYVYGLLHSPDYRSRYADNLSKELPRIPCVNSAEDFWQFSQAGRKLADLHINYETVTPYKAILDTGKRKQSELTDYYVSKMKHPKVKNNEGKSIDDLTTVIYNHAIIVREIPEAAYNYVVNGKPAIKWVMERQCVKTDKASGIVNDANDWAIETMSNEKYPLELLLRVITVSIETNKIVDSLPDLELPIN